jgi:heme/copper-type cytochrome/quinol oxidase subunit 2
MSLITGLIAAAEETHTALPMEPIGFGAIAAVVFVALGIVMWSYRDVANRHSDKTSGTGDHHTPGH